jgi:hypothetical protein
MLVKRTKNFGIPTFGLKSIGRSMGYGKGATMNTGQRIWAGTKGTAALTGTAALIGAGIGTAKVAGATKDALTGNMGNKEEED